MAIYRAEINLIINTDENKPSIMQFCNGETGDYIRCEIVNNKILKDEYTEGENGDLIELLPREITFNEFLEWVSRSVQRRVKNQ